MELLQAITRIHPEDIYAIWIVAVVFTAILLYQSLTRGGKA